MDLITIILFALGLCFDSFAVSISCGMSRCTFTPIRGVRFAAILALLQGLMPLAGWLLASKFHQTIETYDHWVAFVLLAFIGGKMIKESRNKEEHEEDLFSKGDPFSLKRNIVLGVATSIDALVAGVAMAMVPLKIMSDSSQFCNMIMAVIIIGIVTFTASTIGLLIGRRSQSKLGEKSELIGGIILIAIGLKVLIEHLTL